MAVRAKLVHPTPADQTNPAHQVEQLPAAPPNPNRLHEATDRLNKVLLEFEDALRKLNLGVSASVVIREDPEGRGWEECLSFNKTGGSFKLVIESGVDGDPDTWHETLITSASRETRIEAVELLPKLYAKLLEAFDMEVVRVEESTKRAEHLVRAVRAKVGE